MKCTGCDVIAKQRFLLGDITNYEKNIQYIEVNQFDGVRII